MNKQAVLSIIAVGLCLNAYATGIPSFLGAHQDIPRQEADEEPEGSGLAQMAKSSGSLLQKESHKLESVSTIGNDIECRVLIINNLIGGGVSDDTAYGGLVLSIKEKYSERSVSVDQDEIEGLLASMAFLETQGVEIVSQSLVTVDGDTGKSTELQYLTRDGLSLGAFMGSKDLTYALKLGRAADWALLTKAGVRRLRKNLELALTAIKGL